MAQELNERVVAFRSIVGFACNQGFFYYLLYLSVNRTIVLGGLFLAHIELFCILLFMVVAFLALKLVSERVRNALLARSLLPGYAALVTVATIISALTGLQSNATVWAYLVEGVLVGVPTGFLLASWGRVLGGQPIEHAVPEVVLGSALAGALCFVCVVFSPYLHFVPMVLPIASALLLVSLMPVLRHETASSVANIPGARKLADRRVSSPEASRLSVKILVGTFVYGLVVGFTESYSGTLADDTLTSLAMTMFFLVLFCLAVYQTLHADSDEQPREKVSLWDRVRLFARHDGDSAKEAEGPLDGAYRLAFMLIMAGFLFAPVLSYFNVSGASILLAGYLGLTLVLICLFLVMGRIAGYDPAVSFSLGFAALFGGELAGLLIGGLPVPEGAMLSVGSAAAGVLALVAYLFLFTERDFRALSVVVAAGDDFAKACDAIVAACGLSQREADILPLALKGRTGERMASELFISKSTVETHLRRIYTKCGVGNRQELIDFGERVQREGVVPR